MANLKDIRNRINSVRSTMQVTSAMKMVSAAKLKKAQNDVAKVRPFESKLAQIISFLGSAIPNVELSYPAFRHPKSGKVLIVAIASDKGLAGAFNSNIVKEVETMISTTYATDAANDNIEILALGKQVPKGLRGRKITVPFKEEVGFYDNFTSAKVYEVADAITKRFENKELREVVLVYNQFVNSAVQNVKQASFLPLNPPEEEQGAAFKDFIIEPSKEEVLEDLIPQALRTRLLAIVRESLASEHGARMTSMHKATDNATELLGDLQLQYNKARQSAITNELIEIVSGASALNN